MKKTYGILCYLPLLLVGCGDSGELNLLCTGVEEETRATEKSFDTQKKDVKSTYKFANKKWNGVVGCQTWTKDEIICERENNVTDTGVSRVYLDKVSGQMTEYTSTTLTEERVHISKSFKGTCEKIVTNKI